MLASFPRRRFDAAKVAVARATALPASKFLVMFLSLGCTGVLLLGGVIGAAIAGLGDWGIGIAVFLAMLPFVAGIINMRPKTTRRKVLDAMACPHCAGVTTRATDDASDTYVLICARCQVVWETGVGLPGDSDHHHHDHTHHHHF